MIRNIVFVWGISISSQFHREHVWARASQCSHTRSHATLSSPSPCHRKCPGPGRWRHSPRTGRRTAQSGPSSWSQILREIQPRQISLDLIIFEYVNILKDTESHHLYWGLPSQSSIQHLYSEKFQQKFVPPLTLSLRGIHRGSNKTKRRHII